MAPVDGTEVVCGGEVVDDANPEVVLHVERCILASSSQLHHLRARVRRQSKLPHFPELLACLLKHADHALDIDLDRIQAHIETESEQVDGRRFRVDSAKAASYFFISISTEPNTCSSMALRSKPGSLASCSLAPRKLWQTRKPSAMAIVVIQMSMPNRATSVSQSSVFAR